MKRILLIVFIVASLIAASFVLSNVQATGTIGTITSDITWTSANSPYNLTGPINVNTGVTLTIEQGVTINLNNFYIQAEGTIQAYGISSNPIQFNNGIIKFTQDSIGWNEQTGTGCIIQNANLNSVSVTNIYNAIKLDSDYIDGAISVSGVSIISNNIIVGSVYITGTTMVWNNTISGTVSGEGGTLSSYPIIASNNIFDGSNYLKTGISSTGYALIVDNSISNCNYGVYLYTSHQQLGGSIAPNEVLERNKISGNNEGIHMEIYPAMAYGVINPSITNNTITQNSVGVKIDGEAQYLTFQNNNLQDNLNYSIYFAIGETTDLNASNNWWGTTDQSIINQTIYDSKNDFNLGTVNFQPVLTSINIQAAPNPNATMPTPLPINTLSPTPITQPTGTPTPETTFSPTPTQSPNQTQTPTAIFSGVNGFELGILAALIAVIVLLIVLVTLTLKRRELRKS